MYGGRREFRSGRALVVLAVAATLLFAAAAVVTYRVRGWTWVSVGLVVATLMGMVGIVERLVTRVQLTEHALVLRDLRGTRSYAASEIERIEEARGSPAAIRLTDGRWVRLPEAGSSLGNSVRAWLDASRAAGPGGGPGPRRGRRPDSGGSAASAPPS